MIHRKQMVEFADFLIRFKDIMKSNIEKTTIGILFSLASVMAVISITFKFLLITSS